MLKPPPGAIGPESNRPLSATTDRVWLLVLVQCTLWPGVMVVLPGRKPLSLISIWFVVVVVWASAAEDGAPGWPATMATNRPMTTVRPRPAKLPMLQKRNARRRGRRP